MANRTTIVVMLALSCAYFFLFVPPNLTGAKDPLMLWAFVEDEGLQFQTLTHMTTRGSCLRETLSNALFYGQYPYGYSFFLTSAMAIAPLKALSYKSTSAYLLVLRQLSPLFMIVAILLLVHLWTGFMSLWKSTVLFLYLASIPAVFENNMWWHPDSLATLFVVLTIFSLTRDDLHFGRWFSLAAFFCGLATGTKWLGQFFFLTIAVYLALGLRRRRLGCARFLRQGILFLLLMAAGVAVANPLLLIPKEAWRMADTLKEQAALNSTSWVGAGSPVPVMERPQAWYADSLRESFGFWWIGIAVLCIVVWAIASLPHRRILNMVMLTWALPIALYVMLTVSIPGGRYFIPIFLPLMSCLGNVIAEGEEGWRGPRRKALCALAGVVYVACGLQFACYVRTNVANYVSTVHRETSSPMMVYCQDIERACLPAFPRDRVLDVLCDSYVYVRPSENVRPRYTRKWSMDYSDWDPMPDLMILRWYYITEFAEPGVEDRQTDREQAHRSHEFYRDAMRNAFAGFVKVYENEYAAVFARCGLVRSERH
jgi:hypothetical protein